MCTKYDINSLIELSKKNKSLGVELSDGRYALKEVKDGKYSVCDGKSILITVPKVKRIISIYGDVIEDAIVKLDYTLVGIPMFRKKDIEESNMIPLQSKDIADYFEVTDTVILHNKCNGDSDNECIEIKHEDSAYYVSKKILDLVENRVDSI